jgi:hypothetical protein
MTSMDTPAESATVPRRDDEGAGLRSPSSPTPTEWADEPTGRHAPAPGRHSVAELCARLLRQAGPSC